MILGHASLINVILYQVRFLAIGCSISTQTLNKYSTVVELVVTYFSAKKQCIIKIYSNDVNSLYIKYLSKTTTTKKATLYNFSG